MNYKINANFRRSRFGDVFGNHSASRLNFNIGFMDMF